MVAAWLFSERSLERGTRKKDANIQVVETQRWRKSDHRCSTIAVLLVVAGCEGGGGNSAFGLPRYAVKGKVLLADGKPLTSGRVVFISQSPPASAAAEIGSGGAFEFEGASGDGLPEAKYRVHIASVSSAGKASGKPPFASKYLDDEDSGLTATVTSDESKNQFEFKLEAKDATGTAPMAIGR